MKLRLLISQFFDLTIISSLFLVVKNSIALKEINLFLFFIFLIVYMFIYPLKNKKLTIGQKIIGLKINKELNPSLIKIQFLNPVLVLTLVMVFTNSLSIAYFLFIINICLTLLDISLIDVFYPKLKYEKTILKIDFRFSILLKYIISNFIDMFIFAIPFLIIYLLKNKFLLVTNSNVYIFNDISYLISLFLIILTYYFYFPLSHNGSTIGMIVTNMSIKKSKKNKLYIPFIIIGLSNLSFWVYFLFLINQLSININTFIPSIILFLILIILLILIKMNLKVMPYKKTNNKKSNILIFIILLTLIITSIKLTNNEEYYKVGKEYNDLLQNENFWNEKGLYQKEDYEVIKKDLKTINVEDLGNLEDLIKDKETTKIVEYINLNKEESSEYNVDYVSYLKEFINLKKLNINVLGDKFDLKLEYGYNYTKEEEKEYSTKLKNEIQKENKEFFEALKSNNIEYEINVEFY